MPEREPEHLETVIIGGGQAGLSVGHHLARRGRPFLILDAGQRVGDAWRNRWDSLRLFTPARYNALEGMPFPAPAHSFPTKDQVADYLEAYATQFQLPVRTGVRVDRLSRHDGGFVVAAGDRSWEADNVVVAMSTFQTPRVPAFASELDPDAPAWRWGNIPIPEAHVVSLGTGMLLQAVGPWSLPWPAWIGQLCGWPLILAGLWLGAWAVRAAAGVDLERPNQLVDRGPYAFSRNPMYLTWTAGYVGVALVAGTAWPLLLLPVVLLTTQIVVLREEHSLERRFGAAYRNYRSRSADTFEVES